MRVGRLVGGQDSNLRPLGYEPIPDCDSNQLTTTIPKKRLSFTHLPSGLNRRLSAPVPAQFGHSCQPRLPSKWRLRAGLICRALTLPRNPSKRRAFLEDQSINRPMGIRHSPSTKGGAYQSRPFCLAWVAQRNNEPRFLVLGLLLRSQAVPNWQSRQYRTGLLPPPPCGNSNSALFLQLISLPVYHSGERPLLRWRAVNSVAQRWMGDPKVRSKSLCCNQLQVAVPGLCAFLEAA